MEYWKVILTSHLLYGYLQRGIIGNFFMIVGGLVVVVSLMSSYYLLVFEWSCL